MQATAELLQENSQLSCQLKGAQKQCALHQQVAKANSEGTYTTSSWWCRLLYTHPEQGYQNISDPSFLGSAQLRATVERLHGLLSKRCDLEGMLAAHTSQSFQLPELLSHQMRMPT